MHMLDIDFGNSRLKWRFQQSGRIIKEGVVVALGPPAESSWSEALVSQLGDPGLEPERIRVASVRDEPINRHLNKLLGGLWPVTPEYAQVTRRCAGVQNAYIDVSRMGVDRWLAMIAGFRHARGGCGIVSAGSALTVDLVAEDGCHIGGYIVPGLQMMLDSLQNRSSALVFEQAPDWKSVKPGISTHEAISHGLLGMQTTWLQSLKDRFPGYTWLVCGGDGDKLLPWLYPADSRPSLVLDGLALALP